jgi:hypothetical protein
MHITQEEIPAKRGRNSVTSLCNLDDDNNTSSQKLQDSESEFESTNLDSKFQIPESDFEQDELNATNLGTMIQNLRSASPDSLDGLDG